MVSVRATARSMNPPPVRIRVQETGGRSRPTATAVDSCQGQPKSRLAQTERGNRHIVYAAPVLMRLVAWVVFVVLLVLLPLFVLARLFVLYKQLVISRKLGVSQTATEGVNRRSTMDWFRIRSDPVSVRLASVLPNTSLLGLRLCLFPLWVKYKLSGTYFLYPRLPPKNGAETTADLSVARTLYCDRILERVLPQVEQFVLLGAGYDARAYGALVPEDVACFELDRPGTQELKRSSLRDAGVQARGVALVPVDFGRDAAFEKLAATGYDPGKKTRFFGRASRST